MKHILLVIMILGTASSGLAGLSSFDPFSGATDNAVYFNSAGSSAFVVVPADTREFQIQITTKQRDLKEQIAELTTARELLRAALEKTGTHIRFDTDDPVFRGKENSVTITAAYAMPKDVLLHTQKIVDAVASITIPANAEYAYTIRQARSLVSDPEKHRNAVTAKALADLKQFKDLSENFTITVEGLHKTLDVLRKNEREFLISLDYNIRLESKSAAK